jgi:hypothetical protein
MGATTQEKPATKSRAKKQASTGKAAAKGNGLVNHPPTRVATLKRAGMSEHSELTPEQAKRADGATSKMSADRLSAFILKGDGAKAAAASKKYPTEIRDAAKRVREILGPKAGAPGPKQVKRVATVLKGEDAIKASGVSKRALKAYAEKKERPDEVKQLQELATKVKDPWATGRRLAAILVALDEVRTKSGSAS